MHPDPRRYPRFAVHLPLSIHAEGFTLVGHTANISPQGLLVRLPQPFAPGEDVEGEIELPASGATSFVGRVRWAQAVRSNGSDAYALGIQFQIQPEAAFYELLFSEARKDGVAGQLPTPAHGVALIAPRKHRRFPEKLPMLFELGGVPVEAETQDVSAGGFRACCGVALKPGQSLGVHVVLPGGERVGVQARVCWSCVAGEDADPTRCHCMGLELLTPPPAPLLEWVSRAGSKTWTAP